MAGRRADAGLWLAASVLCVAAVATVAGTVGMVWHLHVALPFWDEWQNVFHFRLLAAGHYGFADLVRQHNEHRLLFPRLVFFADELLFGLSGRLSLTVTFALQAANAVILILLAVRRATRPSHRVLLAGFVATLLFTLRQEQNFSNGFQVQFIGVFTAAMLAALAYAAALDRMRFGWRASAPYFAAAALASAVSAYTMANGVLTGFVLAAAAVLARAPARVPIATVALSTLLAALFFRGYSFGGDSLPPGEWWAHAWAFPRFVTAYLGNPLGSDIRPTQGFGLLGLALTAGAAWRIASGRERDASGVALLAIVGVVLAAAGATTYGRIRLGTEQAFESRYATPSLLFWAALVVFWLPTVLRSARRHVGVGVAFGALMGVLTVAACWFEAVAWPDLAVRATAIGRVSDSLLSGVYDADAAATYDNVSPEEVAELVPFLRDDRLAAFAGPDGAALGRPVALQGGFAPPTACEGSVLAWSDPGLGPGGVRLSGTARDDADGGAAPRRILVAVGDGAVAGFGSGSLPSEAPRSWIAYARARPGDVLHAYARLRSGTLCDLGAATVRAADPAG